MGVAADGGLEPAAGWQAASKAARSVPAHRRRREVDMYVAILAPTVQMPSRIDDGRNVQDPVAPNCDGVLRAG